MVKRVELFDGTILEFPDDTDDETIGIAMLRETGRVRFGDKLQNAEELPDFVANPLARSFTPRNVLQEQFPGVDNDTLRKLADLRATLALGAKDDQSRLEAIREFDPDAFIFPAVVGKQTVTKGGTLLGSPLLPGGTQEEIDDERIFFVLPSIDESRVFAANKPGLSRADVGPLSVEALLALATINPLARGGAALVGGAAKSAGRKLGSEALEKSTIIPRVGEIIGVGVAGAGASAAQDTAFGLEEGRAERALETGLLFAGFETFAPVIGKMLAPSFQRLRGMATSGRLIKTSGESAEFTPAATQLLKDNGIVADKITLEGKLNLNRLLKRGADQDTFLRAASGESLPSPIRKTKGQQTQDQRLLDLEQEAATGELGRTEARRAQALATEQKGQLAANREGIAGELGAEAPSIANVQERLLASREARKQSVDKQFNLARTKGGVSVPKTDIAKLNTSLDDSVKPFITEDMPKVRGILKRGKSVKTIDDIFNLRSSINRAKGLDPSQNKALNSLKGELDKWIDNSLTDALLAGDAEAISLYKKAIKARTEFGEIFQRKDFVQRFTTSDGSGRLAVEADEMANYLFGRTQLGAKAGLKKDLTKLKKVLTSEEWDSVRVAAWQRFFRNAADDAFPTNFSKELDKSLRDSPDVMNTLFSRDEINLFRALQKEADTVFKGGDVSPELVGKARRLGRGFQALIDSVPIVNLIFSKAVKSGRDLFGKRAAKKSLLGRGRLPPNVAPPPPGAGGIAAVPFSSLTGDET